jgi:hypothetical protein
VVGNCKEYLFGQLLPYAINILGLQKEREDKYKDNLELLVNEILKIKDEKELVLILGQIHDILINNDLKKMDRRSTGISNQLKFLLSFMN